MTRFVDRGAIVAGYVGVGMAAVIVVSFLLVVPIELAAWLLMPLGGVIIGYYADSRSERQAGPWRRILGDAAWAGLLSAMSFVLLVLLIKGVFFFADDGYRGDVFGGRLDCQPGPACVYARYREADATGLAAGGITDVASFSAAYWRQQVTVGGAVAGLTLAGSLVGGLLFGLARPRDRARPEPTPGPQPG
ncbi:MAG TPA: hypothetical protein VF763_10845 [Candidatus Limnocylindrales bacterium]